MEDSDSVGKAIRRATVWDFPGYLWVFGALGVTDNGCHQKQQMFKSLYLMKTGSAHFLAVFPLQEKSWIILAKEQFFLTAFYVESIFHADRCLWGLSLNYLWILSAQSDV